MGRDQAKRHQRLGLLGDDLKRGLDALDELIDRLNNVISGNHRHHRLRIALQQHRRRESDRIGGIAPLGLPQHIVRRQLRQVLQHRRAVTGAGTNEDPIRREQCTQALIGKLQQRLAMNDRQELFRSIVARKRPETSPPPPCHDYSVFHKSVRRFVDVAGLRLYPPRQWKEWRGAIF